MPCTICGRELESQLGEETRFIVLLLVYVSCFLSLSLALYLCTSNKNDYDNCSDNDYDDNCCDNDDADKC